MRSGELMNDKSPIILALDFPDIQQTAAMIRKTSGVISIYKLGLEFFLAHGKPGVREIQSLFPEIDIFLDLKLHDIPNTVAGASASVSDLAPRFLTVHASGGVDMVAAAVAKLPSTSITAVTILTSLDSAELRELGLPGDPQTFALSLARRAISAGAGSIVCSPHEASAMRKELGPDVTIITPGVRPIGSNRGDQNRVMTPRAARDEGADYVVIGRPITHADDPASVAEEIKQSLI